MTKSNPIADTNKGKRLHLSPLPPYEGRLLATLAFLLRRKNSTQASNCLTMYLRQSEARITSHADYYAKKAGITTEELMDAIYTSPKYAQELLGDDWWNPGELDESRDDSLED